MKLKGRVALVTGAGRGIGRATAIALAREGAHVAVAARTRGEVETVAAEVRATGSRSQATILDVTSEESVRRVVQAVQDELGGVDLLVNNAGAASSAPLAKVSLDDWERLFAVNATGTFLPTREIVPTMVERGFGRVVNVASVAGLSGARYVCAYTASKHAVIGFTRSVAAEVANRGVTVNAICPGYVNTDMTQETITNIVEKTGMSRDDARASIVKMTPQRRLIEPEEVAQVAVSLCCEESLGINGQSIVVDGGGLLA